MTTSQAKINAYIRPTSNEHFYWYDQTRHLSGHCHIDDWPVEWEFGLESVSVVIPAREIVRREVEVPEGVKLDVQAMAYSIEDDVASDVNDFHWISLEAASKSVIYAVDRAFLIHWKSLIEARSLRVTHFYDELDLVPITDDAGFLGPELIIRRRGDVAVANPENMAEVLALPLFNRTSRIIETDIAGAKCPEGYGHEPGDYWAEVNKLNTDFAVGRFKPAIPWRKHLKSWGWAAVLAVVMLAVEALNGFISLTQLEAQTAHLRDQQFSVARSALPGAQISDPYFQLKNLSDAQRNFGINNVNDIVVALFAAKQLLGETMLVQKLELAQGAPRVVVSVQVPDFTTLERLQDEISSSGFRVQILNSQARNGVTTARIGVSVDEN